MEPPAKNRDEIFHAAAEITDAEQRDAYLRSACGDDAALRSEIEELLQHDAGEDSLLDAPSHELHATIDMPMTEGPGAQIGPYKLLQQIGEGGMGVVYMAEQREPIKRRVALKVVKPGMDSRQVIARFEAERQALAMMDHPNIAKVLDVGATPSGRPYFVMELVKGETITEYCNAKRLTIRERIELLIPVLRAIQHAHQKGVIHRDIKPSNVLVGLYDQEAVPKVIDFGVAKAMHQPLTEKTMFTGFGQVIGTLGYMSPEQARVNNLDIDTRSDVYSLGVLLYELLSGLPPFDPERLRVAAIDELLRILRDEQPPKPSTRLSTAKESVPSIAAQRGIAPSRLAHLLGGELDWVIMKALEKDRDRRYETADALAKDLQRFLDDEAVEASPPSLTYRLGKFVRQHKLPLAVATLVLATLVTALTLVSGSLVQTRRAKAAADEATQLAEQRLEEVQAAEAETIEAYRSSLDDAINRLILSKDQLGEQERAYLENALQRWLSFAQRKGDERHAKAMRAQAKSSVGKIYKDLVDYDQAYSAFDEAIDIYRDLIAEASTPELQFELASTLYSKASIMSSMGLGEQQPSVYRESIEILKQLQKESPNEPEYGRKLSDALNNLGVILRGRKDSTIEESNAAFEASRGVARELTAKFPDQDFGVTGILPIRNLALNYRNYKGDYVKALEMLNLALDEFRELARLHSDLDLRSSIASCQFQRAITLAFLDRRGEAIEAYEEAVSIQRTRVEDYPNLLATKFTLATYTGNYAAFLETEAEIDRSSVLYKESERLLKELVRRAPNNTLYRSNLTWVLKERGRQLTEMNQVSAAIELYEQVVSINRELRQEMPEELYPTRAIATYSLDLAELHRLAGNPLEARRILAIVEKELSWLRGLPDSDPHTLIQLARLYASWGELYRESGDEIASRQSFVEAVEHWRQVREARPESKDGQVSLARDLARSGDVSAALKLADELRQHDGWSRWEWYNLAIIYTVAHRGDPDENASYADLAFELLARAQEKGFRHYEYLEVDPEFALLRTDARFQTLVDELKKLRRDLAQDEKSHPD